MQICTEILFDPVTFLNCLHHNCGSCAKRWFSSQAKLSGSFTCPVCRRRVRGAGVSPITVSILADFLQRDPSKDRAAEEKAELRLDYKPGDSVLPEQAATTDTAVHTPLEPRARLPVASTSADIYSGVFSRPRTSLFDTRVLQRVQPPRSGDGLAPRGRRTGSPSAHIAATQPTPRDNSPALAEDFGRLGSLSGSPHRQLSPPPEENIEQDAILRTALPRIHPPVYPRLRGPSLQVRLPTFAPSEPVSVLEILERGANSVIITCDHCQRRLDTSAHVECTTCPLFHVCLRCYRSGRTCIASASDSAAHYLIRQKLIPSWPRRYLQVGIFCDVCDTWIDEDRNGGTKTSSMFWHCQTCNNGCWTYCMRCVQRGWNCTHELELYSNNRRSSTPHNALVRGGDDFGVAIRRPQFQFFHDAAERAESAQNCLRSLGYTPWTWPDYTVTCSICQLPILAPNTRLHCYECAEGQEDLCTTCFYNLYRYFPSAARSMHSFFVCPRGHAMSVLAQPGKGVLHRGVFAHAPKPRAPEWIMANAVRPQQAVAVRAHWPDELDRDSVDDGERKWGWGQWLCFPEKAEIMDVVTAFTEGEGGLVLEWCWGSYAGVGGLFPREWVRFV